MEWGWVEMIIGHTPNLSRGEVGTEPFGIGNGMGLKWLLLDPLDSFRVSFMLLGRAFDCINCEMSLTNEGVIGHCSNCEVRFLGSFLAWNDNRSGQTSLVSAFTTLNWLKNSPTNTRPML